MSEPVVIYHNPRCSKSRRTLELLQESGIDPQVIEYLQTPPTVGELQQLLSKLQRTPGELVRKGEPVYSELGLDNVSDAQLLGAMHDNPILIERPIVVRGERAVLGRPPENVLELI